MLVQILKNVAENLKCTYVNCIANFAHSLRIVLFYILLIAEI